MQLQWSDPNRCASRDQPPPPHPYLSPQQSPNPAPVPCCRFLLLRARRWCSPSILFPRTPSRSGAPAADPIAGACRRFRSRARHLDMVRPSPALPHTWPVVDLPPPRTPAMLASDHGHLVLLLPPSSPWLSLLHFFLSASNECCNRLSF